MRATESRCGCEGASFRPHGDRARPALKSGLPWPCAQEPSRLPALRPDWPDATAPAAGLPAIPSGVSSPRRSARCSASSARSWASAAIVRPRPPAASLDSAVFIRPFIASRQLASAFRQIPSAATWPSSARPADWRCFSPCTNEPDWPLPPPPKLGDGRRSGRFSRVAAMRSARASQVGDSRRDEEDFAAAGPRGLAAPRDR